MLPNKCSVDVGKLLSFHCQGRWVIGQGPVVKGQGSGAIAQMSGVRCQWSGPGVRVSGQESLSEVMVSRGQGSGLRIVLLITRFLSDVANT